MSIPFPAIFAFGFGTHRRQTRFELVAEIVELKSAVAYLDARHEAQAARLDETQVDLGQARDQLAAATAEIRRLQAKVIRAGTEHQRLRQAVINARPRITVVDTQLVRPYAPVVELPYTSPLEEVS